MQSALTFPLAPQSPLLRPGLPNLADQSRLIASTHTNRYQSPSNQHQHVNGTPVNTLQRQQAASSSTTAGQPPLQAIRPKRPIRSPENVSWSPTRELLSEPGKPSHEVMKVGTQLASSQQVSSQHLLKSVCKALGPTSRPPSKASMHLAAALQAAAVVAAQRQEPQSLRQQQQRQQQHATVQQPDSNEEASQQQQQQVTPLQQPRGHDWQSQSNPQQQHSPQQQHTQLQQQVLYQQPKQQLMQQASLSRACEAAGISAQHPTEHSHRQQQQHCLEQQSQHLLEQRGQHRWHSGSDDSTILSTERAAAVHGDLQGDVQWHERTQCRAELLQHQH